MLGGIELQQVQKIDTDEDQVLTQHSVPALEGDFLQGLGRRATRVTLAGVMSGADAAASLKTLRDKYRAGEVVSFIADIATATKVDQVLIEEFGVRELAGKPARFEYELTLREFIPPPPPESVEPPPRPPLTPNSFDPEIGKLVVEVIVEGEPGFDFSTVIVTVEGLGSDGTSLSRTMTNRTDNTWTDENMPPGQFTVRARAGERSGLASAQIRGGQTTQVTITLQSVSAVAAMFLIHFRFDKGFVEPCLRGVLREIAQRAAGPGDEKILILGHTDRVDNDAYNQSLSERRARAVFAFLTFGGNRQASIDEWEALRRLRTTPRGQPTLEDRWGTREYQHILQDLGFYLGKIDGRHGDMTDEAVRAYRCHKGLPPGTQVDDEVWHALIEDYLAQDNFNVPTSRFFPNCGTEIVKWLGAGEEDPFNNTPRPHRPNRRVEVLFVRANSLPGLVPQPDTFNLRPPPTPVNSDWCIGPRQPGGDHVRFVTKHLGLDGRPQPCTAIPGGPFCREPADPRTLTLRGSIRDENGTLLRNQPFTIITPAGEFLPREGPTGEGEPQTTATGEFSFPDKPAGFYSLEVPRDVLVRNDGESDATIKGNTVCKDLRTDSDHLDVVVVNALRLREVRLPVVAHLMTALHPTTREIRTCATSAGGRAPQATALTNAQVSAAVDQANSIWRQARIRFTLDEADIVREFYAFRTECEVNEGEFITLLQRCGEDDVVNVFFVGNLAGAGEAGFGLSTERGAAEFINASGCGLGDRVTGNVGGLPIDLTLNDQQRAQLLAHELGHFLNLDDTGDTPANANRLMRQSTSDGSNRALTPDEVNRARASKAAADDCVPLTLSVTGATRVGSSRSNHFLLVLDPAATVTVDAQIPARLLDPSVGVLTMTGGNPGASPLQRTVSGATAGATDVIATYTPAGGNPPIIARVVIRVVTFELGVDGATRSAPGSTIFIASRNAADVVTVSARIAPELFCVPAELVQWNGGTPAPDPLRRTVARNATGPVTVTATLAGVTRSVTITVIEVSIGAVALVGQNQTADVPITIAPAPLPPGVSIQLRLSLTTGTGEARFVSTNSTQLTITQTTTVAVRGITASSVADNIRLTASFSGQPEIIAQRDLTVVAATIASVQGVRPGQTLDIPVTVTPSPLPVGSSLTLELRTTSGTGAARFATGNPTTTTIDQTTTVTVQGVTASSAVDNIRLTVRITGQTAILAQEDFTVLNAINFFLRFEVWNLTTRAFEPLPAGIRVDLMDEDVGADTQVATQQTDNRGRVLFSLADFSRSGEDEPDLYFVVRPNGVFHAGHVLPNEWSTKGWRATNGSPGLFEDFSGNQLGSEAAPLTYRVGLDLHARVNYRVDGGGRLGNIDPAPPGVGVAFFVRQFIGGESRKRTFPTDANGEVHGVIFDVEGGDSVFIRIDFKIEDPAINLRPAEVSISEWDTDFDDNAQTSLGAQTAPVILLANSDDRNVALYFLKVLRELSTFLFHMTGGVWTGFDQLRLFRSSISGVAFSWPVGDVNLPPVDHWDRGTIVHEITHQTMWKEHDRSSLDIAFEALFGDLALTHFENQLANPEHALIEGWPEFTQAVFASTVTPPYNVTTVSGVPLGPPPSNRGESVEGAFANALWAVFENHVVTSAVFTAAGRPDARVAESVNGNIVAATPWLTNLAVRQRFLSIIWNPFRDLRTVSNKTTTAQIARMRARNLAAWHQIQPELNAFNLAMAPPTITAVAPNAGPAAGGQAVTITGTNFVQGMQVRFTQAAGVGAATGIVVVSSTSLTGVTPPGTAGPASVRVTTPAGTATSVNAYTYA